MPSDADAFRAKPLPRRNQLVDMTEEVRALMEKKKFNPVARLIEIAVELRECGDNADDVETELTYRGLEVKVVVELAQYVAPKLRSVDTTVKTDSTITVISGLAVPPSRMALLQRAEVLIEDQHRAAIGDDDKAD